MKLKICNPNYFNVEMNNVYLVHLLVFEIKDFKVYFIVAFMTKEGALYHSCSLKEKKKKFPKFFNSKVICIT